MSIKQGHSTAFATRMTLSDYDAKVKDLQIQALQVLVLRYSLAFSAFWVFVWGTVSLVACSVWGVETQYLAWGGMGLLGSFAAAAWYARRWIPSKAQLRALLDQQARCGGLLMAANETQMGQWERHIPKATTPVFTWKSGRAWGILTLSFVYLAASFMMPKQFLQPMQKPRLQIDSQVNALKKQIKVLKVEKVLGKKEAKELEAKLNQVKKQASGRDPAKTWQALDHLNQKLQQKARKGAEKALADTEKWAKLEQQAKAMTKKSQHMKPSQLSKAMKKLSKSLKKMMSTPVGKKAMTSAKVSKAMKRAMSSTKTLSMKYVKMSSGVCKSGRMISKKMLMKMIKAGLITKAALSSHAKLSAAAKKGAGMMMSGPSSSGKGKKSGSSPGRGGVSRGGGAAPLTWKPPSSAVGAKFKPIVLSPSQLANLRRSQVIGMSVADPAKKGKPGQGSVGKGLQKTITGQSSGRSQVIYPQHRGTVQRYFLRTK